ncbi:uncharacterized protein LOC126838905 [Adelges cooleyi]|uniref:uncharacterized protein LOC126838905 n=1 Tax=Adelges cooleyi TaxID=133065 RepID=UPI0021805266|nr:uncharacterized protein LOC126838905 [Adelges cooleyi]
MDLEDPRVRWITPRPPTVKGHERKRNDRGGGGRTSSRKTKGKNMCPTASGTDKGTKASRKPAQINPLMTVLMSSRQQHLQEQQQHDQPASRTPERLTACRTVNLELPEHYLYRSTVKRSAPSQRKLPARKCIVPDEFKLKVCLRW